MACQKASNGQGLGSSAEAVSEQSLEAESKQHGEKQEGQDPGLLSYKAVVIQSYFERFLLPIGRHVGTGHRGRLGADPALDLIGSGNYDDCDQKITPRSYQPLPDAAQVLLEGLSRAKGQPDESRPEAVFHVDQLPEEAADHARSRHARVCLLPAARAVVADKPPPAGRAFGSFGEAPGGIFLRFSVFFRLGIFFRCSIFFRRSIFLRLGGLLFLLVLLAGARGHAGKLEDVPENKCRKTSSRQNGAVKTEPPRRSRRDGPVKT